MSGASCLGSIMKSLPLYFLIALLFMSDYALLSLGAGMLFSSWKEVLTLGFVTWLSLCIAAQLFNESKVLWEFVFPLILIIFFLVVYLLCGDFSIASVRMLRAIAMPIIFALIITMIYSEYSLKYKLKVVFVALMSMSVVSSFYAVYQYMTITEAYQFWYWSLLEEKDFELQIYNSMRDGQPRMSGFFTGTLEFAAVILNSVVLVLSVMLKIWRKVKYALTTMLLFSLFFLFSIIVAYSTVRTSLIGLISSIIFLLLLQKIKNKLLITLFGYGYFFALTGAVFAYLSLGYTDDLSALDRPRQWSDVISSISSRPLGYGLGSIGPGQAYWFDSFWLNLLAGCGIIGAVMMIGMILFYKKIIKLCCNLRAKGGAIEAGFADYMIAIYPFYLSSFFFQSYTNSVALYLFVLVVVVVVYEYRFKSRDSGYRYSSI